MLGQGLGSVRVLSLIPPQLYCAKFFGHQSNLEHSNGLKRMEEQFLNFLSDDLLKFCSHEDNYFVSSAAVSEELDALTNLSSKDVEEYFAECSEDYSDAKRENDKSKIKASKNTQVRKFALPKTDDEVVEARKSGIPIKTQKDTEWCFSIWEEWRQYRNKATYAGIAPIELLD